MTKTTESKTKQAGHVRSCLLKIVTLGMWEEPFDRKACMEEHFPMRWEAFSHGGDPEKNIASSLKCMYKFSVVNYYETQHNLKMANFRSIIAIWVAVISIVASVVVGVFGILQAHEDSESTTRALVDAIWRSPRK